MINFITKEYGTVIIGDIYVKDIVKKDWNLGEAHKDLTHALSFYKLKMRLEYKCAIKGINYCCVDEYGTSKMCSRCGKYNDVGKSKEYKCAGCRLEIDRDINATRTIKMNAIKKK